MTSQGSPSARFQRALATGNPLLAWAAAAELPRLSLEDALALVLVLRGEDRYSRAAARWLGRLAVEANGVDLGHVSVALDVLEEGEDFVPLAAVCWRVGQPGCARLLERR